MWLLDAHEMVENIRAVNQNIIVVPGALDGQDESIILRKGRELLSGQSDLVFDVHGYQLTRQHCVSPCLPTCRPASRPLSCLSDHVHMRLMDRYERWMSPGTTAAAVRERISAVADVSPIACMTHTVACTAIDQLSTLDLTYTETVLRWRLSNFCFHIAMKLISQ